jgi:hypothetical protein
MQQSKNIIATRHGDHDDTYYSDYLVYDGDNLNKIIDFTGSQTNVLIPDNVTEIGASVFSNNTTITHVQIGTGLVTIDNTAFLGCTSLEQVIVNSTVLTTLGDAVFSGCTSLTTINLPASVSSIGYNIFKLCSSLTSVTIDPGNAYISVAGTSNDNTAVFDSIPLSLYIDTREFYIFCGIYSNRTTFRPGETATVTFEMSTPTTDFSNSFITVVGGTLSTVNRVDEDTYIATFTPMAGRSEPGYISVSGTSSDGTTTFSSSETLDLTINTVVTTVGCTITSTRTSFTPGQTATVTFAMSIATTDFSNSFITVVGGSLSNVTTSNSGSTYTAIFTPTASTNTSGSISVSGTTSDARTTFTTTSSPTLTINTVVTTIGCTITSSPTSFTPGQTATVTFAMSTATTDFSNSFITVVGGSLSTATTSNSGSTYTATFTPTASTNTSGSISVSGTTSDARTIFTTTSSPTLTINTVVTAITCTLSASSTVLYANQTSIITFTMNKSTTKFTSSVIELVGGTLGTINGDGSTYTATFTPTQNISITDGYIRLSGTSSDNTTTFVSDYLYMTIYTNTIYCTISALKTALSIYETTTITFTMSKYPNTFSSSEIVISGGTITSPTTSNNGSTYTATFTSTSESDASISVSGTNGSTTFASNTLTITSVTVLTIRNATNAPINGASVFYIDSDGNKITNSPVSITDINGDFTIATSNNGENLSNYAFKLVGGKNTLTNQTVPFWYAPAGTITLSPITNLLYYCRNNSLTNNDITSSIDIDASYDFTNYNYYKVLMTTSDKESDIYKDALKANNLSNAINVFATVGATFLYGMNGTDIDTEYDNMMKSIADISISRTDGSGVVHNDLTELFGTDPDLCNAFITNLIKTQISLFNTRSLSDADYAELFANALAGEISSVVTAIMGSPTIDNTKEYETIGYNVTEYVYSLVAVLKPALENPENNKDDILAYFTRNVESIFKTVSANYNNTTYNTTAVPGFSNRQTLGNIRSSENAMMRRQVVKSWNTAYANGIVNGAPRVVTPFRAVTNSGDFLQRENYVCGGPNQINASKPGWKGRIGSIISKCDYSGIPSSTCNVKYVADSSDYIKYKKLRANNQNYNDLKGGGYQNSSYTNLMHVRRR